MAGTGGARKGAGRKSKAEELGLPKLLSKAISDRENLYLIKKIFKLAKEGSVAHAKLYMEYKYGKPKESSTIDLNIIDIPAIRWTDDSTK